MIVIVSLRSAGVAASHIGLYADQHVAAIGDAPASGNCFETAASVKLTGAVEEERE
jgi:hypothetical protein